MYYKNLVILLVLSLCMNGCSLVDDWASDVDPLISDIEDEALTGVDQLDFLVVGLKREFSDVFNYFGLFAGGLSDELFYDSNVPGTSWELFYDVDQGFIDADADNAPVHLIETFSGISLVRFLSDDLLARILELDLGSLDQSHACYNNNDCDQIKNARYNAYLYGGLARYYVGQYFGGGVSGSETDVGGGFINNSEFIPTAELMTLSNEYFTNAVSNTSSDSYEYRLANSFLARNHLYTNDYSAALEYAGNGLMEADPSYQAKYSAEGWNDNWWYYASGGGRIQYVNDYRFPEYVSQDSAEAARLILTTVMGIDGVTEYSLQNIYTAASSPSDILTWQEVSLIKSECNMRQGSDGLSDINTVRASHGLSALGSAGLAELFIERDKELYTKGARLIDQRRSIGDNSFVWPWYDDNSWGHLPDGTWKYLRIPFMEYLLNPNG